MEVLAWAVTLGLGSYVCAQWVVVVPFVKTVSGIYLFLELIDRHSMVESISCGHIIQDYHHKCPKYMQILLAN